MQITVKKGFSKPRSRRSALTRFMKDQCANWTGEPEEECLGVTVLGEAFRVPGPCYILEDKPCKYFKNCVLGPEENKYPHSCFTKDPSFETRVRRQYKQIDHTTVEADIRRCPDCEAALQPRQRYCDKCSAKRRRKSQREQQKQFRRKRRD